MAGVSSLASLLLFSVSAGTCRMADFIMESISFLGRRWRQETELERNGGLFADNDSAAAHPDAAAAAAAARHHQVDRRCIFLFCFLHHESLFGFGNMGYY